MKDFYTVADLQRVTGLSRDTVCSCIRTGELPGYKLGKQYRIPAEAFERFCRGEWVAQHRPVFSEQIRALPEANSLIRKRSA